MLNITNNMSVLSRETGDICVTEYIIGHRFYINVTENQVSLTQDEEFNMKTFGSCLDLNNLWNRIQDNYNISEEDLFMAPIQEYTLSCILFDNEIMMSKGYIQQYPNTGVLIVEVKTILGDERRGGIITQSRVNDFCTNIPIPSVEPVYTGDLLGFHKIFEMLRNQSKISLNGIGGGLVVKNEPPVLTPDGVTRWFIAPNTDIIREETSFSVEAMAEELVAVVFNPEKIKELEDTYNVDPTKKVVFKNVMFNYLITDMASQYEEYLMKCSNNDLNKKLKNKFDTLLRKNITSHLNEMILNMDIYKHRKSAK